MAAAGALLAIRPVRRLGVPTRRRALGLAAVGAGLLAASAATGGATRRIEAPATLLDEVVPRYQFDEEHAINIAAPAERVYRAVLEVTPDEIALYRTLTWIRRFGRSGEAGILNPTGGRPILESALRSSFRKLAERPDRELVIGTLVIAPAGAGSRTWTREAFAGLEEPGFAKAAMSFLIEPGTAGGCRLRTTTRVYATDPLTRRAFTPYWRTIYPGSALIRRMWLRAIKARAEAGPV